MDLLEAAKKKDPQHLICRAVLGHRWNPNGQVEIEGGMYLWAVTCDGCGTVRTLHISAHGYNEHNSYNRPDGYDFVGFGRLNRDELARLRRFVMEQI
jgi:hypothetical protein